MQDDFGDFLQATPSHGSIINTLPVQKPTVQGQVKPSKDLDAKIKESFDLSSTNQRASVQFKQPTRHVGKKPQSMQYRPSSNAADWSKLDVKTSEFTHSSNLQPTNPQPHLQQPNLQPTFYMHQNPASVGQQSQFSQNNIAQSNYIPGNYNAMQMNFNVPYGTMMQAAPAGAPVAEKFPPSQQMPIMNAQTNAFPNQQTYPPSMYNVHQNMNPAAQFRGMVPQTNNLQSNLATSPKAESIPQPRTRSHSLPPWMTRPNKIPSLYKKVLKLSATPNSFADTSRLYPILVSSKLPKDMLGHIWSVSNQSTPGQLTFTEVYIALALIGLAQTGDMNLTVQHVTSLKVPPVPHLQFNLEAPQPKVPQTNSYQSVFSQAETAKSNNNISFIHTNSKDDEFSEFQSVSQANIVNHGIASSPQTQVSSAPLLMPSPQNINSSNFSHIKPVPKADFEDFQQFPSKPNVGLVNISSHNSNEKTRESDFGDFSQAPAAVQTYPDRNLINSPNSRSLHSLNNLSLESSPTLATSGVNIIPSLTMKAEPKISKSSSSKSLPSASKSDTSSLGVISTLSTSNLRSRVDDDFGAFKMNTTPAQQMKMPVVGNLINPPKQSAKPSPSGPLLQNDLMSSADMADKYSALRDLFPTVEDVKVKQDSNDNSSIFSDFQSSTPVSQGAQDLFSSDADSGDISSLPAINTTVLQPNGIKISPNTMSDSPVPFGKACFPNVEKLGWGIEDSSSVKSLELPSLSDKIASLSIGSSSPFQPSDMPDLTPSLPPQPLGGSVNNDDQLYSLDEPISPPTSKKHFAAPETKRETDHDFGDFSSANFSSAKPQSTQFHDLHKPISPPRVQRRTNAPRKISEAESDFGDFSAAPPPIDDISDHYTNEFDMYQEGNSSLVDFDAFGHFEENRQEKKKEVIKVGSKPKKEESTAFTEFIKSSAEDMSITVTMDTDGASDFQNVSDTHNDEDWSGFSTADNDELKLPSSQSEKNFDDINTASNIDTVGIMAACDETVDVISNKISDLKSEDEHSRAVEDLKLTEEKHASEQTEWDLEGEEMKARLSGTTISNPMELYIDHWGRCLTTCKDIIVSTGDIFAALNSPTVCREIVNSTRGREFISCTSEVYGVARRIRGGMESVGLEDSDLEQALKDIEIAWNNLLGFCPYTPSVHKTPEHCCKLAGLAELEGSRKISACSVCLLSTEGSNPVSVAYGGQHYHAPCANLWLNQVAPILPRLVPPSK